VTFDPHDPQPDYATVFPGAPADFAGAPADFVPWRGTVYEAAAERDTAEETYRLALESAQRWLNSYRLSPAMRLRALRAVVGAALSGD
jgi:hypothetical protein